MYAPLKKIARKHGLYLDYKHVRPARGNKKKVAWTDYRSNIHDLDYVLENGGSETTIGSSSAFIETAWRWYTRHFRNKAQLLRSRRHYPFLGVVLAGVFTEGSLQQLRSHGFSILYFPYETICRVFAAVGIDPAFDENTSDAELQDKFDAYESLAHKKKTRIVSTLMQLRKADLDNFLSGLETALKRTIEKIYIVALHGSTAEVASVHDTVAFIEEYPEDSLADGFVRYEINVEYSNKDKIIGSFGDKRTAIEFLHGMH